MKTSILIVIVAFILICVEFMIHAHAGPEITGIPRGPRDKGQIEKARLSAQLCGPGWALSDDREHSATDFVCVPVKPKVPCPPNSQVLETDCSIGCISRQGR
jgi:hypothetical protein